MTTDLKPPIRGYSIWFMAGGEGHDQLRKVIEELGKLAGGPRFNAHATLLGLLDYTSDQKKWLEFGTETLARQSPPIDVELLGIGMRNVYFQSMFLPIVPTQPLMELNQTARLIFHRQNDPPFMPHVSLLYGDFDWQLKREALQRIIATLTFPLHVTFDQIALVRVDRYPNEWVIEKEFPFAH